MLIKPFLVQLVFWFCRESGHQTFGPNLLTSYHNHLRRLTSNVSEIFGITIQNDFLSSVTLIWIFLCFSFLIDSSKHSNSILKISSMFFSLKFSITQPIDRTIHLSWNFIWLLLIVFEAIITFPISILTPIPHFIFFHQIFILIPRTLSFREGISFWIFSLLLKL